MDRELPRRGNPGDYRPAVRLAGGHERPGHTRWPHDELLGADIRAEGRKRIGACQCQQEGQ
jgi:hypothetical protein